MNRKAWWRSRTLWVNLLALAGLAIQSHPEVGFVLTPEKQVAILGAVNLGLRLITGEAVGFQDEKAQPSTTGPGPFPGVDGGGPGVEK